MTCAVDTDLSIIASFSHVPFRLFRLRTPMRNDSPLSVTTSALSLPVTARQKLGPPKNKEEKRKRDEECMEAGYETRKSHNN